jgi:hypothetical protein
LACGFARFKVSGISGVLNRSAANPPHVPLIASDLSCDSSNVAYRKLCSIIAQEAQTKRLCLLAAVSLIASFVPTMADTVFVDADAAAKSADLESVFPGVRLSTSNGPDGVVRACDGFSEFLGRNLATSGTLVFCQDPPPLVPESWDESTNLLRADFTVETDHVQIDLICDDDDVGELRAFDAFDNLLEAVEVECDGRTDNALGTAVVKRDNADIAYITAGGNGGEGMTLDSFQFNNLSPVCEIELQKDAYAPGEVVRAEAIRISNPSSTPVAITVIAWLAAPGVPLKPIWSIRKRGKLTLEPGEEQDLGSLNLRKVPGRSSAGTADVICRLVDKITGGHYDTSVSQFEVH